MNTTTARTIVRPWNCPSDVPLNCWVRRKGCAWQSLVIMVNHARVGLMGMTDKTVHGEEWKDLEHFEYSNDRITWLPCTVEIPAPIEFHPVPEWLTVHNPDGLTAEQVGEGWRLLATIETDGRFAGVAQIWAPLCKERSIGYCYANQTNSTYRVPASTPYPEKPKTQLQLDGERCRFDFDSVAGRTDRNWDEFQRGFESALTYARTTK